MSDEKVFEFDIADQTRSYHCKVSMSKCYCEVYAVNEVHEQKETAGYFLASALRHLLKENDALQARVAEIEKLRNHMPETPDDERSWVPYLLDAKARIATLEASLAAKTAECEWLREQLYDAQKVRDAFQRDLCSQQERINALEHEIHGQGDGLLCQPHQR